MHTSDVNGVRWSPDGKFLATVSDDHTTQLWTTADWQLAATHARGSFHNSFVLGVVFTANSTFFATSSWDKSVQVFLCSAPSTRHWAIPLADVGWGVAAHPVQKSLIAVGQRTGEILFADLAEQTVVGRFAAHKAENSIRGLNFDPSGQYLLSASFDSTMKLWDYPTRTLLFTFEPGCAVNDACFLGTGSQFSVCAALHRSDDSLVLINVLTKKRQTFPASSSTLAVASPQAPWLIGPLREFCFSLAGAMPTLPNVSKLPEHLRDEMQRVAGKG
eukprot:TRINITY_DN7053_c0_g1_i2.p1 TRINITY_DN7053_c0_g1~~TRINITY_DN7053_c0_g1_i2.p1  ORF type:complete len:274 (+),score=35.23 TRINITY_DN7053_c0_g1_i2:261-1082(+)